MTLQMCQYLASELQSVERLLISLANARAAVWKPKEMATSWLSSLSRACRSPSMVLGTPMT